jgi:hypothetical protein
MQAEEVFVMRDTIDIIADLVQQLRRLAEATLLLTTEVKNLEARVTKLEQDSKET